MKEKVSPKLRWSLNVGGNDDVLYRLPRSSNTVSLIDDQWCKVPIYDVGGGALKNETSRQQASSWQQPKGSVEVAIFQPSWSNHQVELTIHDPHHHQSSSYQLDANNEVLKMQVVSLPPGGTTTTKDASSSSSSHNKAYNHQQHQQQAFGVLLVLATVDGIFLFSLVFTRQNNRAATFVLSECLELSDMDAKDPNKLLKGRRVREMKSQVIIPTTTSATLSNNNAVGSPKDLARRVGGPAIAVVASSLRLPAKYKLPPTSTTSSSLGSSQNVDAFTFPLKDHQCPMFQYSVDKKHSGTVGPSRTSLNLLKGVCKVKNVGFLGNTNLREPNSSLVVTVLLEGELKLIPIPIRALDKQKSTGRLKIKVQTILLAGICAHPSISGLGETMLVQSSIDTTNDNNNTSCDLAILCRPKLNEIGFKAPASSSSNNALLSTRKTVKFSPVEHIQEVSPSTTGDDDHSPTHFFPPSSQTPGKAVCEMEGTEWQTPRIQKSTTADKIQIISPESEEGGMSKNETQPLLTQPLGITPTKGHLSVFTASVFSPLVGLDLIDSKSTADAHNDSTILVANTSDREDVMDLTGKWSTSTNSLNLSPSLMSGLHIDASNEKSEEMLQRLFALTTAEQASNSLSTPVNFTTGGLGPRSALKSIQCTTPFRAQAQEATNNNTDHLSHIIIVHIEQERFESDHQKDKGGVRLKIGFSSAALPPSLAKFDSASLKWGATNSTKTLYVTTSEAASFKLAKLSLLGGEDSAIEVDSVSSHDLRPLFSELENVKEKWTYKLKGVAIEHCGPEALRACNCLEVRLLLWRQPTFNEGTNTICTPMNMSATETTRICLASASLPLEESESSESIASGDPAIASVDSNAAVILKLDQVMKFLQSFEAKMDARMDGMERRLGGVEESMRTV